MAITVNVTRAEEIGNSYIFWGSVTFDSSYPTGGEAFSVSSPVKIEHIEELRAGGGGYVGEWDHANQKLKAYYGDNNNASDGPLIQVPDTTDLSSVTMTFIGVGQ